MKRALPLLLTLLLIPPLAPAQPTTQPTTQTASIDALLRDLGAADFAARERAQHDLIAAGGPARPGVERLAHDSPDPEVKSRAAAVLRALNDTAAFSPTRLTLHLKDAAPAAALQALAAAAGVKLALKTPQWWKLRTATVTLDADEEPFWPVFFRLAKLAGAKPTFTNGGGQLFVEPADPGISYPTCYSGPFAVQARGIRSEDERAIDFSAGRPGRDRSFDLFLTFCAEPKLVLASVADRPVATEATDDRGHDLLTRDGTPGRLASRDATCWASSLSLDADAIEGAKSIRHLKGFLHVEVADLARAMTIAPLAAGASAEQQGIRLSVDRIDSKSLSDTLFLRITHPLGDPTASDLLQSIDLFDAAGLRLDGFVEDHYDDGRTLAVQFAFTHPEGVGPAVKLTWPLRGARRPVVIPFEFHDLPLP